MSQSIDELRWRPILDLLIETLEKVPDCREKRMVRFWLEELFYHFWHYKLGPECTCTDIDFIEYKIINDTPKIVGMFEVKTPLSSVLRPGILPQRKVEIQIAQKLNVPLWLVTCNRDLKTFQLKRLDQDETEVVLGEREYIDFHRKKLRGLWI